MTSFGMLSGLSGSQPSDATSNIFDKAIENAGAGSLSPASSATDTDSQYTQKVMQDMGIGTGLDVSV